MKNLYERGQKLLAHREGWERKQRTHFHLRHNGMPRPNKPFSTAADVHVPLVDMMIRRYKPFWFAQVFNNERLAQFVAIDPNLAPMSETVSDWFDYILNQRTNLEDCFHALNDCTNLRGRGVLKAYLDASDNNRVKLLSIDPWYLLMEGCFDNFEDADEWIHVQQLTVAQYQRNPRFDQRPETIEAIRGGVGQHERQQQDKERREGITFTEDPDKVLLWEHWQRTKDGQLQFTTYSPKLPDQPLRVDPSTGKPVPWVKCPYTWQGKSSCPFHSFQIEVKDPGWYSPRGLAELLKPIEAILCKLANEKLDNITFRNRPMLTAPQGVQINTGNVRFRPGEFVPGGLQAVDFNGPPMSYEQEMDFWRNIAELIVAMPDFGVGNRDTEKGRTATEVSFIQALSSVNVEMNGRLWRRQMAKVYQHIYAMLLSTKDNAELQFLARDGLQKLPAEALAEAYLIQPDGSADQWNKPQNMQRALALFSTFNGHPLVKQEKLVQHVLSADDSRLSRELFQPNGAAERNEQKDEANNITLMVQGWPVQAEPYENHLARIPVLKTWLEKQMLTGAPVDPIALQRVHQLLAQRVELLKKLNPKAAQQVQSELVQAEAQASGMVPPAGVGGVPGTAGGADQIAGGVPQGESPVVAAAGLT